LYETSSQFPVLSRLIVDCCTLSLGGAVMSLVAQHFNCGPCIVLIAALAAEVTIDN
jgi:hypothetical protein